MIINNMKAIFIVALVIFSFSFSNTNAQSSQYDENKFKQDLFSPYKKNPKIILIGSALTLTLVATRETYSDKWQKSIYDNDPLGDYSKYGDYTGQWLPNIVYASFNYFDDNKSKSIVMLKATAFAGGTTFFLKRLFNQERPSGEDRNSFPSGHTTTAFAFASVIDRFHPQYRIPAYLLASFVGLSRINDNAHYPHDVIMGATIGMMYGYSLDENKNISFTPLIQGDKSGFLFSYKY